MLDRILSDISEGFAMMLKRLLIVLAIAETTWQVGLFLIEHSTEIAHFLRMI